MKKIKEITTLTQQIKSPNRLKKKHGLLILSKTTKQIKNWCKKVEKQTRYIQWTYIWEDGIRRRLMHILLEMFPETFVSHLPLDRRDPYQEEDENNTFFVWKVLLHCRCPLNAKAITQMAYNISHVVVHCRRCCCKVDQSHCCPTIFRPKFPSLGM